MNVNYDKLWRILNQRNMLKTDLIKQAKISTNAMAKLGKNEDVRFGILVNICKALNYTPEQMMEFIFDEES